LNRTILDPDSRGAPVSQIEIDRAPVEFRRDGAYPDIRLLQPGDLLLVSPLKPGPNARLIQWAQKRVHRPTDAQWMHAAIYLGDNALVEIDGGGVQVSLLFKYARTHRMLFRRVLDGAAKDIDEATGFRIAIAALKEFKRDYAYGNIVVTAYDCVLGRTRPASPKAVRSSGAICSDFFNEVVFATCNRPAAPIARLPLQPADLSASKLMRDIDVPWAQLV
jgi:hypothetical protein